MKPDVDQESSKHVFPETDFLLCFSVAWIGDAVAGAFPGIFAGRMRIGQLGVPVSWGRRTGVGKVYG